MSHKSLLMLKASSNKFDSVSVKILLRFVVRICCNSGSIILEVNEQLEVIVLSDDQQEVVQRSHLNVLISKNPISLPDCTI